MAAEDEQQSILRLGGRALALLFLLALAVRLAATLVVGFSTLEFGDARAYLFAARYLAQTGTYPDRTEVFFFRPPGYPAFLVLATLGDPSRIPMAKVGNCVLGALAPLLLALISARVFRLRGAAIATGVAASLQPSFVHMATQIQSEPLFLLFLLCAGFLLLVAVDRPSSTGALAAGACLGLAALTRSTALALGPFLLAPLQDRRYPLRARWHLAASALLGFAFALAPWTLRNALVFHELIPVNDAGGLNFYSGNSLWAHRYYEIQTREEYDRWASGIDADLRAHLAELERSGKTSPSQRSAGLARLATDAVRADPGAALRLLALKAWHWIRPYPTPWFWPAAVVIGVGILYGALDVLALVGLFSAQRRGVALFCVLLLAMTMAVHVVLLVVWRHRTPYWDPVLLLYAVFGASTLLGQRTRDRRVPLL